MNKPLSWISVVIQAILLMTLATGLTAHAAYNDGQGREWRLALINGGATWSEVAQACPQDGVTACKGIVHNVDLSSWVWATEAQLPPLLGQFAPDILSSPSRSVAGPQYITAASNFIATFGLTAAMRGCPTYQPCFNFQESAGITASRSATNVPIKGGAQQDLEFGAASFSVGPSGNDSTMWIGIWQSRPTGLSAGTIHAYDDMANSPSPSGGMVVNVLANDWVGGAHATSANVTVAAVTPLPAGFTLGADGAVNMAAGTLTGRHTFRYRICSRANLANCGEADVSITVNGYAISAVNDQASVSFGAGASSVVNVLANDRLGAIPATTAIVQLAQLSSTHPGISLNLATGLVNVAAGTSNGPHSLDYRICERANPVNCAQASVTLNAYTIDAVNDTWRLSSRYGATSASVLANDWFNGAPATTTQVTISLVSPLISGVTFNNSTGVFTIARKTSSGDYTFIYQICETANPGNCDTATVILQLSGRN